MAEHDGASDRLAVRAAQHLAVGDDGVPAEAGAARDLGDEWGAEGDGERLGLGPCTVASDDDGRVVGFEVDHIRAGGALPERARIRIERLVAVGDRRDLGDARFGSAERLAVGEVQVHGTVGGGAQGDGGEFAHVVGLAGCAGGGVDIPVSGDHVAEDADLVGGLVGADAAQLARAVGGEQHEWHARVVRLEHSGVQVRDGSSRGADDGNRAARLDSQAQGREASDAFVDAHVHAQQPGALESGGGKGDGLRARAGADDDVLEAEGVHPVKESHGRLGGRARRRAGGVGASRRFRRGGCRCHRRLPPRDRRALARGDADARPARRGGESPPG